MALTYRSHGKRVMDTALAGVGLVVAGPLCLGVAGAIAMETGRPVLFVQDRVGENGSIFRLYKFRSMAVGTPDVPSSDVGVLTVTKVGKVIRRLNLDELPQLVNIVRGAMSLVGPRPALPSQDDLLDSRRLGGADRVRPGLTGLAQVNSYDGMSVEHKAAFDNQYASEVTFVGDLRILAQTVGYLFNRPPVY